MSTFKEIAKGGATMFAVGVALALIAVPMAQVINAVTGFDFTEVAAHNQPLWTGAFFGAFGAIHAAFAPIINRLFGDSSEKPAVAAASEEKSPTIIIAMQPEKECSMDAGKHALALKQERESAVSHPKMGV